MRDAAIISVGYDTLCRSAEIAMMQVEHLREASDGRGNILIPTSKGDPNGDGRVAWLSPATSDLLDSWLAAAGIENGPLFRALNRGRVSETALDTCSIRRLVKRAALRAGCAENEALALSGHSMRVGAAQDMLVAGFDSLAIMQAGGWKTPNVLLRYVENAATQVLHQKRWQSINEACSRAGRKES
jgi:integrase